MDLPITNPKSPNNRLYKKLGRCNVCETTISTANKDNSELFDKIESTIKAIDVKVIYLICKRCGNMILFNSNYIDLENNT